MIACDPGSHVITCDHIYMYMIAAIIGSRKARQPCYASSDPRKPRGASHRQLLGCIACNRLLDPHIRPYARCHSVVTLVMHVSSCWLWRSAKPLNFSYFTETGRRDRKREVACSSCTKSPLFVERDKIHREVFAGDVVGNTPFDCCMTGFLR